MKKRKKILDKKDSYSKKSAFLIPIRYFILLALVIILLLPFSNPIIYTILTPLTVYPVIFLLKLFVTVSLNTNPETLAPVLTLGGKTLIEIVPACIAGAAYILILILNLSVPMKAKNRINSLLLSIFVFLIFNILRIFVFSLLYHNLVPLVDITHKIFWYGISTIFIVGIWFFTVKTFKIKEIPFYSDIKFMLSEINKK